jgi:ribosomal protein S18 acetylase RimI-like enzyme
MLFWRSRRPVRHPRPVVSASLLAVEVDGLPPGHTAARQRREDTAAVLAVVHASDIAVLGHPDFSAEDVEEVFAAPHCDPARDTWVVRDAGGAVVAWAYADSRSPGGRQECDVYLHPEADEDVRRALLAAVVARCGDRAAEAGVPEVTVDFGVVVGDDAWAADLRAAGFEPRRRFSRMRIELDGPRPAPEPPPGVTVSGFDPASERDWAVWHATYEASFAQHWGHEPVPLEAFRARVLVDADPGFPDWRLAVADGVPVGIAQCPGQFVNEGGGWIRNLGVLPGHRGRGIARFLLEDAFARFAARGLRWAGLGVDTSNATGALRLYEAVGMRAVFQVDSTQREVPASPA